MLFQIVPGPGKDEDFETLLLEVTFHVRRIDSMRFRRVQRPLDQSRIGAWKFAAGLSLPVLHDHRDTGSAAAVFFLFDEGHVEPHAARLRRANQAAETQK